MEKEIYKEIIYYKNYNNENEFKISIQKQFETIKKQYPECCVTKDFVNERDIVIRAVKITDQTLKQGEYNKDKNRDRADGFQSRYDRERTR